MAAEIQGAYFKAIIGSMTAAASRFPQHQQRVNQMKDDTWYAWDDYVQMAGDLQATLGDKAAEAVAQRSAQKTLALVKATGFDSVDKLFGDFDALVRLMVRSLPPGDAIHTVSSTPTSVELKTGTRLPPPVVLGMCRGYLMGFGKIVTEAKVRPQGNMRHFSLKWM